MTASHSSNSDEDLSFRLQYTLILVEGSDHEGGAVGDNVKLPEWLAPILIVIEKFGEEAELELQWKTLKTFVNSLGIEMKTHRHGMLCTTICML